MSQCNERQSATASGDAEVGRLVDSSQADDRRLIGLVRARRLLYSRNNMPVASFYVQVKALWEEVANEMGWSGRLQPCGAEAPRVDDADQVALLQWRTRGASGLTFATPTRGTCATRLRARARAAAGWSLAGTSPTSSTSCATTWPLTRSYTSPSSF